MFPVSVPPTSCMTWSGTPENVSMTPIIGVAILIAVMSVTGITDNLPFVGSAKKVERKQKQVVELTEDKSTCEAENEDLRRELAFMHRAQVIADATIDSTEKKCNEESKQWRKLVRNRDIDIGGLGRVRSFRLRDLLGK